MHEFLVEATEVAALMASEQPPSLLDVRWRLGGPPGLQVYLAGHLPGAVYVDMDTALAAPPGPGGRHPLPERGAFEDAMRRAGVHGDREVVVYDDADATAAARAWWMLRYFGHPRVRVLNGGYRAWAEAGLPVSTDAPHTPPGSFSARPGAVPAVDADGAAAYARDGVLLDARSGERYRGETEPVDPVAGHIPGARSAPTAENVDSAGRFLPSQALAERFATVGAVPGARVAAYCGSGIHAAHEVLALALAGVPASLYVGSWSNWVADPGRPVATGPDGGRGRG